MKTEENGTIILSEKEEVAAAHRDMLVGFGDPIKDAAQDALSHMDGRPPSKAFAEWLSEGTLTVTKGKVVATEQPEEEQPEESTEEESTEESGDDEAGDEEKSSSKAEPVSV